MTGASLDTALARMHGLYTENPVNAVRGQHSSPDTDLSITTFVDRVVETYQRRNIWLDLFV